MLCLWGNVSNGRMSGQARYDGSVWRFQHDEVGRQRQSDVIAPQEAPARGRGKSKGGSHGGFMVELEVIRRKGDDILGSGFKVRWRRRW